MAGKRKEKDSLKQLEDVIRQYSHLSLEDFIKIRQRVVGAPVQADKFLTVKQVAEIMQVHPITVRRWIAEGALKVIRIGKRAVRIPASEIAFREGKRKREK